MKTIARRDALRQGAGALSAVCMGLLLPGRGKAAAASVSSCVEHESESLLESLQYTDMATDPAMSCKVCAFFSQEEAGACGKCMLANGPVSVTGHCDGWAKK